MEVTLLAGLIMRLNPTQRRGKCCCLDVSSLRQSHLINLVLLTHRTCSWQSLFSGEQPWTRARRKTFASKHLAMPLSIAAMTDQQETKSDMCCHTSASCFTGMGTHHKTKPEPLERSCNGCKCVLALVLRMLQCSSALGRSSARLRHCHAQSCPVAFHDAAAQCRLQHVRGVHHLDI